MYSFRITPISHENSPPRLALKEHKKVYAQAFAKAYANNLVGMSENESTRRLNRSFERDIIAFEKNHENWFFFQATTDGGRVVGYASFNVNEEKKSADLHILAVAPDYAGQGVGKSLTFKIRDEGVEHIYLTTRKANISAVNFYKSIGFRKSTLLCKGLDPEIYEGYEWHLKQ